VALALDRPLLAVDLPDHGHSDAGRRGSLRLTASAADIALVLRELAPNAAGVVGMSLGGLTAIALGRLAPDLVRRLVLVDVTPGVNSTKATQITEFINGPPSFSSFEALLERTVAFNPTRTESSLRRGILHNAVQQPDGTWIWRYRRFPQESERMPEDVAELWEDISALPAPIMLVRGMLPQSVVDDADEAELRRRRPDARVAHVADAGHSVQGDSPIALAALIADFVASALS
jgi:pimeloyl-ACP methyl ester carboxylesterase